MSDGGRRATERKRLREKTVKSELKVRHADQPCARIRSRSRHVLGLRPALIKRVQKGFVHIYFLLHTSLFLPIISFPCPWSLFSLHVSSLQPLCLFFPSCLFSPNPYISSLCLCPISVSARLPHSRSPAQFHHPILMVERRKQTAKKSTGGKAIRVLLVDDKPLATPTPLVIPTTPVPPKNNRLLRSASKSPTVTATPSSCPVSAPPPTDNVDVVMAERYDGTDHVSFALSSRWPGSCLNLLV